MSGVDWLVIIVLLGVILLAIAATARFEARRDEVGAYRPFLAVVALLALTTGVIIGAVTLSLGESVSGGRKLLFGGVATVALGVGVAVGLAALTGKVPRWVRRTLDWLADQPF